jgi:hypothetical protein
MPLRELIEITPYWADEHRNLVEVLGQNYLACGSLFVARNAISRHFEMARNNFIAPFNLLLLSYQHFTSRPIAPADHQLWQSDPPKSVF